MGIVNEMGRILKQQDAALPRPRRWLAMLAVAGVLCAGVGAVSSEPIRKSFATLANPALLLHSHSGAISVKGWNQNQVEIKGERASDAMEVLIVGNEEKVTVQTHPKRQNLSPQEARVDLEIHVPRQALVRVESEQGDIAVEDLEGDVAVEGVTNSVTLSRIRGHITARTVDGPILIRSSEGHVQADSITGDLKFVEVNGPELIGTTNSGAIRYQGEFGSGGTYMLHNYSSPIEILASPKASFDLTASSVQGTIENQIAFRPLPPGTPFRRPTARKLFQGRVNSGKSTVNITSYSGTIRLSGAR